MGHYRSEIFSDEELAEQEKNWRPPLGMRVDKLEKRIAELEAAVRRLSQPMVPGAPPTVPGMGMNVPGMGTPPQAPPQGA